MNDLRFALRQLLNNPGFTAVAALTLALGIGANLALFTVLYDQFLRPRALTEPETLWQILPADASGSPKFFNNSWPYYEALRRDPRAFRRVIGMTALTVKIRVPDGWESARTQLVSGDYFDLIGVHPCLGRGFLREEDGQPGTHSVGVISHRLWQSVFHGDPEILGKTVTLKGDYPEPRIVEIVGVAGPDFVGLASTPSDVIMPLSMETLLTLRSSYRMYGRLGRHESPQAAAAALTPVITEVTRTLHSNSHLDNRNSGAGNNSGYSRVALLPAGFGSRNRAFVYNSRFILLKHNALAAGGSLLILAIAALNLAGLLSARGFSRRREFATRLALGATRGQLVRQLVVEGVLIASLGTLVALLVMKWLTKAAPALWSIAIFTDSPVSLQPDLWVLGGAALAACLIGVAFSVLPALQATCFDPIVALNDLPNSAAPREGPWELGRIMMIGQVGFSLVLLTGATLCFRTLAIQLGGDVGFPTERLLVATTDIEGVISLDSQYVDADRRVNVRFLMNRGPIICEELRRKLSALPGVEAVGFMDRPPHSSSFATQTTFQLPGHEGSEVRFHHGNVGVGCFDALGIRIAEGREVTGADVSAHRRVALVNESFRNHFWAGEAAVGREVIEEDRQERYEIIGVVEDARLESPNVPPRPTIFFGNWSTTLHPTFLLRTRSKPDALLRPVATELTKTEPWLKESKVQTYQEIFRIRFATERNVFRLLAEMSCLAMCLTAIGTYGLMTYHVSRRTREIGLRLAIGAPRSAVVLLVVNSGMRLALIGIALGFPLAWCASQLIEHVVGDIDFLDGTALLTAGVAVLSVALLASWLPARRASRIDPIVALRME